RASRARVDLSTGAALRAACPPAARPSRHRRIGRGRTLDDWRCAMITVREADGRDVAAIRDIFLACYGTDYCDPRYYDAALLTRLVYSDSALTLVAEETGRVIGTASVDLEVGARSDLVGEFGRLAVHPEARHRGAAKLLMAE